MSEKFTAGWYIELAQDIMANNPQLLIKAGWTPPQDKEPEFKPGDFITGDGESFYKVDKVDSNRVYTTAGGYLLINECRHAPTWVKWETGEIPKKGVVLVQWNNGRIGIRNLGQSISTADLERWAWMPEER